MKTIITSLPHATNDGRPTGRERAVFYATLRASGVTFTTETPCYGFWYADDGKLYEQETEVVTMRGSEAAIRLAVGNYGAAIGDLEMLFVEYRAGYVLEIGEGRSAAMQQARKLGGATLKPNGEAWSLNYASLVAGLDYADTNLVR